MIPFRSIQISGYRSFSDEGIVLRDLSRLNFLCGQNNSGKSNILRFLCLLCNKIRPQERYLFESTDYFYGGNRRIAVSLCADIHHIVTTQGLKDNVSKFTSAWAKDLQEIWFDYDIDKDGTARLKLDTLVESELQRIPNAHFWEQHWRNITGSSGGGIKRHWVPELLNLFHPLQFLSSRADLIPAFRTVADVKRTGLTMDGNQRPMLDGMQYHGGMGTIERLFQDQHPAIGRDIQRRDFDTVQEFLREITGNPSVELEIPADKSTVIASIDGRRLALSHLGSGIEELVVLATAATHFKNQIVCIEEPELHVHPLLQRKLIQFLHEKTDNTYFIATHSANILDAAPASVYHVKLEDHGSTATYCNTGSAKFQICHDLGYRASDILQTNSVIWVEGPSDRIYLNHWLSQFAPILIEGLDYSIMFYGGRLLSHLSADDQLVDDFINLNRLNRNVAILMDSDKNHSRSQVGESKRRVAEELSRNGGFGWITKGREIENYLNDVPYAEAIRSLGYKPPSDLADPYVERCVLEKAGKLTSVNKLKLARAAVDAGLSLDVLDLRHQLNELTSFVARANGKNI